jgi:hypothetical protein
MAIPLRSITACLAFFISAAAPAAPAVWQGGFGQGWQEYSISNGKASFRIACNEAYNDTSEHSIEVTVNGRDLFAEKDNRLAIVINGATYQFNRGANEYGFPNVITSNRNDADNWKEFIAAVSRASRIEFYYDGKKAAEIKPKKSSLKELKFMEESCRPLIDKSEN